MPYKYQALFDEFELTDCPGTDVKEISIPAYRWSHDPINHPWNFLPNILYDRVRKKPVRVLEKKDIAGVCNISFFIKEDVAREKLETIKKNLEKKHQKLVDFYTHLAFGQIEDTDGKATDVKNSHFGFYEYVDCNFFEKFNIIAEI